MASLIEVFNLSKSFGNKLIIDNVSFSINKGEIFGIIGQSGAGKTVLLKSLIGFYKPEQGDILYDSQSIFNQQKQLTSYVGFASQKHSIYYDLTIKENLHYFGRLYGLGKKEIFENSRRVLELVELSGFEEELVENLSGGMQRRVDLACAMIHFPNILILDEPTSGLDPVLRKHMSWLIQKISSGGTTVILSSHFMNEIEPLCNRILMLKDGKMVAYGSPAELLAKFSSSYEITLRTYPGDYASILKILGSVGMNILSSKLENNKLVMYVPPQKCAADYLETIVSHLGKIKESLIEIQLNHLSLENLFERMVVK